MDTYETLHAGDVVLGHDGQEWGVAGVFWMDGPGSQLAVALTRQGQTVTGYPPSGTPVTVLSRADTIEEARAYAALAASFGGVEVLGEVWNV